MATSPIAITARVNQLDRRFSRIFDNTLKELPQMRDRLYTVQQARKGADEKFGLVGEMGNLVPFDGQITYDAASEGYNVTATHKEYSSGMQVTRTMRDYDLTGQMDREPSKLARATERTLEEFGARIWTMAFSNDNLFYSHSEGVPLCSNSHTTTSGASTATGFDNLGTAALSAVAVAANRIQMKGFRGDHGQRISVTPTQIWHPPALYETAFEIVSSMGKVETADNNRNVHNGRYALHEWEYMSNDSDWFMLDGDAKKDNVYWFNSAGPEFANTGEFDTLIWKWRVYVRFSYMWLDWRWVMGNDV